MPFTLTMPMILWLDANGDNRRNLTESVAMTGSLRGLRMAGSDRDGNDEIYVMGSDGSNPRRLPGRRPLSFVVSSAHRLRVVTATMRFT